MLPVYAIILTVEVVWAACVVLTPVLLAIDIWKRGNRVAREGRQS